MEQAQRIKVALVGEGGVGKTTFLTRLLEERFDVRYTATMGVEMHTLKFSTNHGNIFFEVWDTAGQERFRGVPEAYFIGATACIAMFEHGSAPALATLKKWIGEYTRVAPATPIAICKTKSDLMGAPNHSGINKLRGKLAAANTFCEISTRNQENCNEPFLWIAREITGHADLVFI